MKVKLGNFIFQLSAWAADNDGSRHHEWDFEVNLANVKGMRDKERNANIFILQSRFIYYRVVSCAAEVDSTIFQVDSFVVG